MAGLTIRPTRRADIGAVDALLADSYPVLLKPDYPPSILVTALPFISRARPELVTSGTYYLVEREGLLLGAGGWSCQAPHEDATGQGGEGHVRHVVTSRHAQRQGVGRALLLHIMAEARANGLSVLHCLATRTAVPFYTALGFVAEGVVEVPLRAGITFPSVAMRRRIDG